MEWECNLPFHCHLVDGRFLCRGNPALRNTVFTGFSNHFRIMRIEKTSELRLIQILFIRHGCSCLDLICVIEQHAKIADTTNASLGTNRRLTCFDPWVAEGALLCFDRTPVVINLLVWATRNTHAPATTFVLIDKYDTVVFTFVYRARWARSNTGRIKAMLAQTRQIHHERRFKGAVHFLLQPFKQRVFATRTKLTTEVIFPIRTPHNFVHFLSSND